jgi:dolichol kinase
MVVVAGNSVKINMLQDVLKITLVSIFFLIIFVSTELMHRKMNIRAEITRKIAHVLSAMTLAILPIFMSILDISIIALIFIIVLIVSFRLKVFRSIHSVKRKTYGEILFPVGVLAVFIFSRNVMVFEVAMLILGFSDTAAELIGKKFGKAKYLNNHTTIIGSIAFFSVTILILSIFNGIGLSLADKIIIGVILTNVEAISNYGIDNLLIPLFFSALIFLSQ